MNVIEAERRAYGAYARECARKGYIYQQPAAHASGVERHAGLQHVVLRNGGGVLAVYRLRDDGRVRALALDRWPESVT